MGPVPTGTSPLQLFDTAAPGAGPMESQNITGKRQDFLPPNTALQSIASQTLGEVHLPGELVLALIEGYGRLNKFSGHIGRY